MTREVRPEHGTRAAPDAALPVTFDDLFGWVHPAAGRRGVVLCGAYGFEQMAAHRPWRALADRIAGPAARPCGSTIRARQFRRSRRGAGFDKRRGDPPGHALPARDHRRHGGRPRRPASRRQPGPAGGPGGAVDRLILLAPAVTGRAYLREMRLRARTVGGVAEGAAPKADSDGLSVGGFRMDADFLADVGALDAAMIARAPAPLTLLLAPETRTLAGRLTALGGVVETGPLPDFRSSSATHLRRGPGSGLRSHHRLRNGRRHAHRPAKSPSLGSARLAGDGWSEAPARFQPDLFGIRCTPRRQDPAAPTVVFVSTGMTVHSGWGRQTTTLARRLAADGIPSFRFDLAGIGDSGGRSDGRKPPYAPDGFADVGRALDHLAEVRGPIVLVGNCSGAHAAFQALCRDARVDGRC